MSTTHAIPPRKFTIPGALKAAAQFSARARQASGPQDVLDLMVHSLAAKFGADRVAFYELDRFGNLNINTANHPTVIQESHVRNTPPEGPLAAVIEYGGIAYIPSIFEPVEYPVLNKQGLVIMVQGYPMNNEVTASYRKEYGSQFKKSGTKMDMLFGCLSVPGQPPFGAFKIDNFPSGRSILPTGMKIRDLLNIVSIVSNSASQSLAEHSIHMELEKEKGRYEALFKQALALLQLMKHDFRGLLGLILGYLELASMQKTPEKQLEKLLKLTGLSGRIKGMVTDLEEKYAEPAERGSFELSLKMRPLDLTTIFEPLRDQEYEINIETFLPEVLTDRKAVEMILFGLIDNAKKYGNGSPISVGCQFTQDGEIEISVTDKGYGIEAPDLQTIFKGGVRKHPRIQGSGQGLAGLNTLVGRLGGRMWAESEGPNKGSTFKFTLPVEA